MELTRDFITATSMTLKDADGPAGLRVMSFNVLAQGLSADSFVKCPAEALVFQRRLRGIIQEITTYDADIICLQEVDMFAQLQEALTDYEGVWMEKLSSPCLQFNGNIGPDGSAIFYKTRSVKVFAQYKMPIEVDGGHSNQVLVALDLQLSNGHRLFVMNLHLKSKGSFANFREKQIQHVLKFVESKATSNIDSIIIAGDLNSAPSEPTHQLIESAGFVSTYVSVTGTHPQYTTSKIRSVGGAETLQCKVEDYIYYKQLSHKNSLTPEKVLEIPAQSSLGEGHLPSLVYPSDHLSMVTDFSMT